MDFERLHRSSGLDVTAVRCRAHTAGMGEPEASPYASVVFVRRGAFRLHFADETQLADPTRAIVFPAGDEYRVDHPLGCGDETVEYRLRRPWFEEIAWDKDKPSAPRVRPVAPGLALAQTRLTSRLVEKATSTLEVEEVGASLVAAVVASPPPAFSAARSGTRKRRRRIVEAARLLMLDDLGRDWTLAEIAAEAGASPFHLTRLFREATGSPLHAFLIRARLAAALDRIVEGEGNLTRLALDLGFSSHSHFSAAFRRLYGAAPSRALSARVQPQSVDPPRAGVGDGVEPE